MLRFLIYFSIIFVVSNQSYAQKIERTVKNFWIAVNNSDNKEIIDNGESILKYIDDQKSEIDSNIIFIRICLSMGYSNSGNFNRSLELDQQTKTLILEKWPEQSDLNILCLRNLALDFKNLKKYNTSLEIYLKIYEIKKGILDSENPDIVQSISDISNAYLNLGDYNKTIDYCHVGLETIQRILKKSDIDFNSIYSTLYNNLSFSYSGLNDFKKALEFNLLALENKKILYGELSLTYILNLESISFNLSRLQNYNSALEYNLKALDLREQLYGGEHPEIIQCLRNIAFDYVKLKEFNKSYEFDLRSLQIAENVFGKNHIKIAEILENIAFDLNSQNKFNDALSFDQRALEIRKQNLGENHIDYISSLSGVAADYSRLGNFEKALEFNLKALEIYNTALQKDNSQYFLILNNIASNYSELGNHKKSLEYNTMLLGLRKKTDGVESKYYALSLNNLASEYSDLGDFQKALELNTEALNIYNKLDSLSPDRALCLHNLGYYYSQTGDYKKALIFNYKALDLRERILGSEHPDYALSLNNIASIYSDLGDYNKSLELYNISRDITRKIFGEEHPEYALSLNNLALNYQNLGKFEEAKEYHLRTLEIYEKTLGTAHPSYALSLLNLSSYYSEVGEISKALELDLNALTIYENSLGNEHSDYTMCLNNIACLYREIGNFDKALELNLKVLKNREKTLGVEHKDYALTLNNLGELYCAIGELNTALDFYSRALKIFELKFGNTHPDYALILNNLGILYSNLGDHTQGLKMLNKALEINNQVFGDYHPNSALNLNNISTEYIYLGNYKNALSKSEDALKMYENTTGRLTREYATALNNVAFIYNLNGDFKKSREFNNLALEIRQNLFGKESFETSMSLSNIALNEYYLGNYDKAIEFNDLALNCYKNFDITRSSDYTNILNNRSLFYFKLKNYRQASNCLSMASDLILKNYTLNKYGLTDGLNISFKKQVEFNFCYLSSLLEYDDSYKNELYNLWIILNGNLSADKSLLNKNVIKYKDSSLVYKYNQLLHYNTIRNKLLENKIKVIEVQKIDSIINDLEISLSRMCKDLEDSERKYSSDDIQSNLKFGEYFVDLARFKEFNFSDNKWSSKIQFVAFIINSKDSIIDYLLIKKGADLENEIFSDYKLETSDKSKATDLKNEIFYNSFWKPIADKIGDAKTVYISLGGVYNNINLNTLYNPETGKYLIEEKDIRIVNSARDFVLMKERLSAEAGEKKQYASSTSALYGFPDFNGNATTSVDSADYLASTRDLNAMWIDSLTRGGLKASPLPATKVEVEQIAGTFQKNGWKVTTYTGENASETNIKKEVSPRVLHVATHGYFFEDIPFDTVDNRFLGMDRNRVVQDPMLRSGLLFTGANKTLQGEESRGENGLLSAAEASLLDLRETELVVLSACETGKGEVKNSEGVYGLRKAFADAGAKNIIMSLWKVDDKVTQEFMTRFYEIWLNEKTSIREAFNRTQLEIKAKYPQPYYWGAFILVGE